MLCLAVFIYLCSSLMTKTSIMPRLERFKEQEIPYEDLARFGLTQEMIDDLPQSVMTRLLSSRETPLLPLTTKTEDGESVVSYARLSLLRTKDGTVNVAFIPRWESNELSEYTAEQQKMLKEGMVMAKDGYYIQFDDTIQQVISVPTDIIRQNLNILCTEVPIGRADYARLVNGEVVQLNGPQNPFSIGIDLNDDMGIRISNGSRMAWKEETQVERLPKYNFGIYGCWMADDLGNLSYVPEELPCQDRDLRRTCRLSFSAVLHPCPQVQIHGLWRPSISRITLSEAQKDAMHRGS